MSKYIYHVSSPKTMYGIVIIPVEPVRLNNAADPKINGTLLYFRPCTSAPDIPRIYLRRAAPVDPAFFVSFLSILYSDGKWGDCMKKNYISNKKNSENRYLLHTLILFFTKKISLIFCGNLFYVLNN